MQYIRIINWQKYQHYKNRRPPWIKLYSKLLRKYEFICLHDDSKLLLIFLWLLASTVEQDDPLIPAEIEYLKSQLPLRAKINLQPLITAGFIQMIAECQQPADSLPQTEASEKNRDRDRKETEKKRASPFVPPTVEEIRAYQELNPELKNIEPVDFFKGYDDSGWIDTKGQPVRNWKLKLRTRSKFAGEGKPFIPPTYRGKDGLTPLERLKQDGV